MVYFKKTMYFKNETFNFFKIKTGFAWFEAKHYHRDPSVVLNMFPPERVPIMSTLAQEFAVFDQVKKKEYSNLNL